MQRAQQGRGVADMARVTGQIQEQIQQEQWGRGNFIQDYLIEAEALWTWKDQGGRSKSQCNKHRGVEAIADKARTNNNEDHPHRTERTAATTRRTHWSL